MPETAQERYLKLLKTTSLNSMEDQIVEQLLSTMSKTPGADRIPIRVSKIVHHFSIDPRPRLMRGPHQGEIEFDSMLGMFVITLCTETPQRPFRELAAQTRLRFTYAHEVAHRFFFLPESNRWNRARDLATASLPLPEKIKERVTLGKIEEGICNNVARRVLVPDKHLDEECPLDAWFNSGKGFFSFLSKAAKDFGVSRDCLLVRLQKKNAKSASASRFALIVGQSVGTMAKRSAYKLRILSGIFPTLPNETRPTQLFPGLELSHLGEALFQFVSERLEGGYAVTRAIDVPVTLERQSIGPIRLKGWCRLINETNPNQSGRILLWGSLDGFPDRAGRKP